MDGSWDKLPADDPASLPREDQIRAEAIDRVRAARTFMSLTINGDEQGIRVASVIASLAESIDNEYGTDDSSMLISCLCESMVRLWFEDIPNRWEAKGRDMLLLILARHDLLENVSRAVSDVLEEKGYGTR